MEGMYEEAKKKKFTLIGDYESICVKCPFCRAYSLIDLGKDKDYVQVDKEYQMILRDVFEEEF